MLKNEETVRAYLVWLGASRTKATVESFGWALHRFLSFLKDKPIELCRSEDIGFYVARLENEGLKTGTRAIYCTALRSMWKWMDKNGNAPFSPDLIPSIIVEDTKSHEPISQEEFILLMEEIGDLYPKDIRSRAILSMLYATGVRLGELMSFDMANLDLPNRRGKVKTYKRRNHWREIFWDEKTHGYLQAWLRLRSDIVRQNRCVTDAVFIAIGGRVTGDRINSHAVQHVIRDLRKRCKIPKKITVHSFRHGYAKRAMRRNIHVRHLQELLGHAKLNTTMIYMQTERKEIEAAARKVLED